MKSENVPLSQRVCADIVSWQLFHYHCGAAHSAVEDNMKEKYVMTEKSIFLLTKGTNNSEILFP